MLRSFQVGIALIVLVSAAACASRAFVGSGYPVPRLKAFPEPGDCFPMSFDPYLYSVHRGGDFCATATVFAGVMYDLDVACETDVVLWVSTTDDAFSTDDGLKVGSTLSEAIRRGGVPQPSKEMPWQSSTECAIVLPSGWVAQVDQCQVGHLAQIKSFRRESPEAMKPYFSGD